MRLSLPRGWGSAALPYGAFVATFLLRAALLLQSPYPPSLDAGGDLYMANWWTGHPIAHLFLLPAPPLYYWLVVLPFTSAFGPFLGVELYMAFVPALLAFPGYLLLRELRLERWVSTVGSFLLAVSAPLSLMVTWNGGFTALGMVPLAFFLVFLLRTLRTHAHRDVLTAGLCLSLTAAVHELALLVGLITLGLTIAMLAARQPVHLSSVAKVLGWGVLFSLPLVPIYVTSLTGTVNVGVGGYSGNLQWGIQNLWFFGWGFQSFVWSPTLLVDVMLSVAGLALLWWKGGHLTVAVPVTTLFLACLIASFADAANVFRGLYFLPLVFVPVSLLLMRRLFEPTLVPIPRRRKRYPAARARVLSTPRVMLVVAVVGLVVPNAVQSITLMDQSRQFFAALDADRVAAMGWIRTNVPAQAALYDAATIAPWIWGYSGRLAYEPQPLGGQVTAPSYAATLVADEIALGEHLVLTPYFAVATDYPSPGSAPRVYLSVPGWWEPFLYVQADQIWLATNGTVQPLSAATYTGFSVVENGSAVAETFNFISPQHSPVEETVTVANTNLTLSFHSPTANVALQKIGVRIPPSGYVADYVSVPTQDGTDITDAFRLNSVPFTFSFAGGELRQRASPGNWTSLWSSNASELRVTTSGLQPTGAGVTVVDTSSLVRLLDIRYLVLDYDTSVGYGLYLRVTHGDLPGHEVFSSGPIHLIELDGTT